MVKMRNIWGVVLSSLLAACSSKLPNGASVRDISSKGSVTTTGLGRGADFSQQEKGERFTTQAPRNQVYLFRFDDSHVAKKYLASLNAQATYIKAHPGAAIMLAGHTDSRGSREYNIALGERRAKAVFDLLRLAGVSRRQMRVVSYGQERPVAYGEKESSYTLNRRVELTYEAIR